jgi:hypothetical protein
MRKKRSKLLSSAANRRPADDPSGSPELEQCQVCFYEQNRRGLQDALVDFLETVQIKELRKAFPEIFERMEARRTEAGRKKFPTIFPPGQNVAVIPWPEGGLLAYTLALARAGNVDASRQLLLEAAKALRDRRVLPDPLADYIAECLEKEDLGTTESPKRRRYKDWASRREVAAPFEILKSDLKNASMAVQMINLATNRYSQESALRRACDPFRDEVLAISPLMRVELALEAVYSNRD